MKVVKTYPPNYDEIAAAFDIRSRNTVVFTYGDTLYNPGGAKIDKPLMRHEETHARQHSAMGAGKWWERYLVDAKFRFEQELEAYRNQYAAMFGLPTKNRAYYLEHIATDLAGPIYGNLVTVKEARQLITEGQAEPTKTKTYHMSTDGDKYMCETLQRNILAPQKLELKIGAEVMFVANNFEMGFFNGTRGKVVKFAKSGDPIVKLTGGRKMAVGRHAWTIKEDDRVLASVEQVPLRLAWAITIHKSQGMSLDAAEVDLSKAFQPAMGYVALSRVRSLDGLYLQGINDMALTMHPEIYEFDAALRAASEAQA